MNLVDNGRGKVVHELIEEDLERLRTILDEVRVILDAEAVGLIEPEFMSMHSPNDLTIKIYGSTLGMEVEKDV